MQNHYNLVYREEEREMIPLCRAEGIGVIPWSPLARGLLAGTRKRDEASPPRSTVGRLDTTAAVGKFAGATSRATWRFTWMSRGARARAAINEMSM